MPSLGQQWARYPGALSLGLFLCEGWTFRQTATNGNSTATNQTSTATNHNSIVRNDRSIVRNDPPTATKSAPATANPNVFNERADALGQKKFRAVSGAEKTEGLQPWWQSLYGFQMHSKANRNAVCLNVSV